MEDITITIPKETENKGGLVAIPRVLYRKFLEWQKEAEIIDDLVDQGEREFRTGRTIVAKSSERALKIYGRRKGK